MMRRVLITLGVIAGYVLLNYALCDDVPFWVNLVSGLPLVAAGIWWIRREPRRNYFFEPFNGR